MAVFHSGLPRWFSISRLGFSHGKLRGSALWDLPPGKSSKKLMLTWLNQTIQARCQSDFGSQRSGIVIAGFIIDYPIDLPWISPKWSWQNHGGVGIRQGWPCPGNVTSSQASISHKFGKLAFKKSRRGVTLPADAKHGSRSDAPPCNLPQLLRHTPVATSGPQVGHKWATSGPQVGHKCHSWFPLVSWWESPLTLVSHEPFIPGGLLEFCDIREWWGSGSSKRLWTLQGRFKPGLTRVWSPCHVLSGSPWSLSYNGPKLMSIFHDISQYIHDEIYDSYITYITVYYSIFHDS